MTYDSEEYVSERHYVWSRAAEEIKALWDEPTEPPSEEALKALSDEEVGALHELFSAAGRFIRERRADQHQD